jgi:hypothetical protein
MARNPLTAARSLAADHPMMQHAKIAHFAHSLPADELAQKTDVAAYVTPIVGALAADPKVTSKDVVKATAQAVADGKVPASGAVQFLSGMPQNPDDLRPWLKGLYATNMTALVHMKAAMMKNSPAPAAAPAAVAPPATPGPGAPAPAAPAPVLGAAT